MIRRVRVAGMAVLAFAAGGCRYHGAVYSSYQQLGLDVRASTESNAPVKVSLSYERGVGALVPKLDVDASEGDAVSLLSVDDVYTTAASPKGATDWLGNPPLRTSSAFISGPAAVVAAAPANADVKVVSSTGRREVQVQTKGGPGTRIATAFRPTARFQDPFQQPLQELLDDVEGRPATDQKKIFDRAATMLGGAFEQKYRSVAAATNPKVGFVAAKNTLLTQSPGKEQDVERRLLEALQTAAQ